VTHVVTAPHSQAGRLSCRQRDLRNLLRRSRGRGHWIPDLDLAEEIRADGACKPGAGDLEELHEKSG